MTTSEVLSSVTLFVNLQGMRESKQLPCARSDYLFDHRSSSSSTTTWRRGRLIGRSLLLCIYVHSQFHFTSNKENMSSCGWIIHEAN
jgi:hypothetical protein